MEIEAWPDEHRRKRLGPSAVLLAYRGNGADHLARSGNGGINIATRHQAGGMR